MRPLINQQCKPTRYWTLTSSDSTNGSTVPSHSKKTRALHETFVGQQLDMDETQGTRPDPTKLCVRLDTQIKNQLLA